MQLLSKHLQKVTHPQDKYLGKSQLVRYMSSLLLTDNKLKLAILDDNNCNHKRIIH